MLKVFPKIVHGGVSRKILQGIPGQTGGKPVVFIRGLTAWYPVFPRGSLDGVSRVGPTGSVTTDGSQLRFPRFVPTRASPGENPSWVPRVGPQ